jgi:hypothetical protein
MTKTSPLKRAALGLLALSALILCAATPQAYAADEAQPPGALVLIDKTPIVVDASALNIRLIEEEPHEYPYVGWKAPVTYEQGVKAWAVLRFKLTGESVNSLRISVKRATITEKLLPVTKGISGWFKKEQGAEYQGTLELEVAIVDPNGQVIGSADAKSWATETVSESATDKDKEKAWMNVMRVSFDNLDRDLRPTIYKSMSNFVH